MKNDLRSLLLCGTMLGVHAVHAQDLRPSGPPGMEARIERMTAELDLTDEQRSRLKAILEEQTAGLERIRTMEDGDQRREAMRTHMRQQRSAMRELLTPEQQEKAEAMRSAGRGTRQGPGGHDPEARATERAERMARELDLSTDQATRIEAILLEHARRSMEMARMPEGRDRDMARQQAQRDTMQAIDAVLTKEQRSRLVELRKARKYEDHGGGRPVVPPTQRMVAPVE